MEENPRIAQQRLELSQGEPDESESESGAGKHKLVKKLTLRDLYASLVVPPKADPEQPAQANLVELPGGPEQLVIEKPPSQDNSQSGSYDPSPRDILMTDPDLAAPSSSNNGSPRKKPGLLNRFFPTTGRRKGSSKEGSGSPSPVVSPRTNSSGEIDPLDVTGGSPHAPSSHPVTSSNSSSPQEERRRTSGSGMKPVVSGSSSAVQMSVSGKIDRLAAERQRKKDDKRELKKTKKLEKLHRREADELIESIMAQSMTVSMEELFRDLPKLRLIPSAVVEPVYICSGPTPHDEGAVQSGSALSSRGFVEVSGRTVSTYPQLPGRDQREGSPICDSYFAQVQKDGVVLVCIADGCGWGSRPREAAIKAKVAMVDHISKHLPVLREAQAVAEILVRSLGEAHFKVIEGKDDINAAGTTTLLGGVLAPIDKMDRMFCFMFVSIGDCKAYCRKSSTGKIIDLTLGSRNNVSDAKDPGGRIGPHNKNGMPDLRNLRISYCICEENDMLILASDGLSDNFDPEFQGLRPMEVGLANVEKWSDIKDEMASSAIKAKGDWGCAKMAQLVDAAAKEAGMEVSPKLLVGTLIHYCINLTQSSREWLENVSVGQLPDDYKLYPGKMDHTTLMAFRISSSK